MTTLAQITASQNQAEVTANEGLAACSPVAIFGHRVAGTSGLTFGYYGGVIQVDGVLTTVADGTVALTASNTNFVEATRAGVVSANTTAFTAGRIPLWTIVTVTSSISTKTDNRAWTELNHVGSFLSKAFSSDANITLSAAEARARIIRLTGTITTTRDVIVPLVGEWTFHNTTSGSPSNSIRIIGASGTGITIANAMTARVYGDGTNMYRASADV